MFPGHKQKRNFDSYEVQKAQTAQVIMCIMSPYHTKLNRLNSIGRSCLRFNDGISMNKRYFVNNQTICVLFLTNKNGHN